MSNLAADKVLRVNCPGWGVSSTLPLGEAKPLAMYDVIVINPTSIIHLFEPKSSDAKQVEKLIGEGKNSLKLDSDSTLESISAELELREHELRQFLSKGGLLIYFLAPPFTVSGASLVMDNYLWLYEYCPDIPDGATRTMKAGEKSSGIDVLARGKEHPFAAYLQQIGLEWSTVIRKDDLAEGYKSLANAGPGKCVSAYKSSGPKRGQVVILPAPYESRYDDVLKECIMKWHDQHSGPEADQPEIDIPDEESKSEESKPSESSKSKDQEVTGRDLLDDLFGDDDEGKKPATYASPAASSGGSDFDSLDELFSPGGSSPKVEEEPPPVSAESKLFEEDVDKAVEEAFDKVFDDPRKVAGESKQFDEPIDRSKIDSDADKLFSDDSPKFFDEPSSGSEKEKKKNTLDWPELEDDVPPFAKEREREKARDEEKERQRLRDEEAKASRSEEKERDRDRESEKSGDAEREREKALEEEKERERVKAEQAEKEREREKAEKDREREKAEQAEKDREREKAAEVEARNREREKLAEEEREREREREREKAREEDKEKERERAREEERERERERMRLEERQAEREREDRERSKAYEEDREREKAREFQRELDRAREEERERQKAREEEREREYARDREPSGTFPEAKDLMSRMEQEISSPGVPDWCTKVSFTELKQLHFELGDLNEQVRKARQKIGDIEDRIRNLGELKDALLSLSGLRLTQACCKVFEALGWQVKISETSSGEVWLSDGDKTQAIVRIVFSLAQPNRSELAELAESVITYWGKYDVEPKGILVASTFAEKAPKERTEEDFPGSMGDFAKRKNLCLFTSMQLLTIYRDVSIKGADVRKIRENLLTTSGILPGFKLETSDLPTAEAAAK